MPVMRAPESISVWKWDEATVSSSETTDHSCGTNEYETTVGDVRIESIFASSPRWY